MTRSPCGTMACVFPRPQAGPHRVLPVMLSVAGFPQLLAAQAVRRGAAKLPGICAQTPLIYSLLHLSSLSYIYTRLVSLVRRSLSISAPGTCGVNQRTSSTWLALVTYRPLGS